MTRIFILALALAWASALRAQIVLDRSDIGVIGAARTYNIDSTTATMSPGPAGANQTWNFTFADDGDAEAVFKAPSQTQFAAQFSESNLAMEISGFTFYFDATESALKTWGGSGTVGNLPPNYLKNNKAVRALVFPAAYGDVIRDTSHFRVRLKGSDIDPSLALLGIDSVMWKRRTIRNAEMDGWGRLTINCGSFPEALRERRTEYNFDTIYTKATPIPVFNPNPQWQLANIPGVPPTGMDTTRTYAWWAKNLDFNVLEFAVGVNDSTQLIRWLAPTNAAESPQITGANAVCDGQSIPLTASGDFVSYQWLLNGAPVAGATSAQVAATQGGTYSVRAVNAEGCTLVSSGHAVELRPAPDATITVNGSTALCEGESVTLSAPAGMASYLWESGQTTQTIVVTQTGNYAVIVTNAEGCTGNSEPVGVTFSAPGPSPEIAVSGDGINQYCFSTLQPVDWEIFNAGGQSVKTGSGTEICVTPTEAQEGKAVAKGCFPDAERTFIFTVGRAESAFSFALYPNPATGAARVSVKGGGVCTATVYDALGRPVYASAFVQEGELPAERWPAGVYRVVLTTENGRAAQTLVVRR